MVAVVVDERWEVAVTDGALPGGAPLVGEPAERAIVRLLRERHALEVEVVGPLGPDAFVCRARGRGEGLAWWPGTRAMRDLRDEAERRLVRKALGPC